MLMEVISMCFSMLHKGKYTFLLGSQGLRLEVKVGTLLGRGV